MTEDHTVAIVSFEGAVKREIKRIRKELSKCDSLSAMFMGITVEGPLHSGDLKLTYKVGSSEYTYVKGDSLQACIDEFLRQHGWKEVHEAKAISYEKIPSDDTTEDEIPF